MRNVNKTDMVRTFDMDGNPVHVFQGCDWDQAAMAPALKAEGAVKARIFNRSGELKGTHVL